MARARIGSAVRRADTLGLVVIFPLVAMSVSGIFAFLLFQQFSRHHGLAQLSWGIAMAMYGLASLFVAFGVTGRWDPTLFRGYWLFGALLNVPYLALGSIALLRKKVLTTVFALIVAAVSLLALGVVASAHANVAAIGLRPYDVPLGKDVWGKGTFVAKMGTYYSIPAYLVVVAIAFLTSRTRHGVKPPVRRVRANWLIAGGATVVAIGGIVARYGRGVAFSIFLALGVIVMFVGFMMASRPAGVIEAKP